MDSKERFIDDLLDATLARRRAAEPPPGLEAGLLSRLRAERSRASCWTWMWRFGLAAATCVALVLAARLARHPGPVRQTAANHMTASPRRDERPDHSDAADSRLRAALVLPRAQQAAPLARNRTEAGAVLALPHPATAPRLRGRRPAGEPRQRVFPSPVPITREERLLLSYLQHNPGAALAAQKADRFRPLEIEQLKIAPLELNSSRPKNTADR